MITVPLVVLSNVYEVDEEELEDRVLVEVDEGEEHILKLLTYLLLPVLRLPIKYEHEADLQPEELILGSMVRV